MKTNKSIENLQSKNLGGFKKAFGSKVYGGCTTWTIKEVVIVAHKKLADPGLSNDGSDGNGPC